MFRFNHRYFLMGIFLFFVELYIALYVNDMIIRPHIGDVLVVILLYCLARAFLKTAVWQAATGVLVFAYIIETLQYFKIVELLGLQHSVVARVIIGTTFSWMDIFCYTIGFAFILISERTMEFVKTTSPVNNPK